MKEAQGSIKLDISQFEKPIETAKSKLASLGDALKKLGVIIASVYGSFKLISSISENVNFAAKAIKYLEETFGKSGRGMMGVLSDIAKSSREAFTTFSESIQTISKSAVSGVEKLKSATASFGSATKAIPQNFKNIALGATGAIAGITILSRVFGVVGMGISLVVSGIQKAFSGFFAILKGVASFIGSVFNTALNVLKSTLKGVVVGVVALGSALVALTAFISRGVVGVFQLGDELKRVRDITGASIPFLMSLQKAFKENGLAAEQVVPVLSEMNRSIAATNEKGEPSSRAIKALGLSVRELSALNPDERFKRIAVAIAGVGDKGLQTAYAMDIFGRFGRNVLAVIADTTAIQKFGSNLDKASRTMAENADRFARISAKLKSSGMLFRGFFTEIAGAVAPQIETIMDMLSKGDFLTGLGTKVGAQLAYGLDVFVGAIKTGRIVDALKLALSIPVIYFKDFFARTLKTIGNIFEAITKENKITILFTDIPAKSLLASLGKSFGELFKAVAKLFAVVLIEQMRTPLAALEIAFDNIATMFSRGLIKAIADGFGSLSKFNQVFKLLGFGGLGDAVIKGMDAVRGMLGGKEDTRTFAERTRQRAEERKAGGFLDFGLGTVAENIQNVGNELGDTFNSLRDISSVVIESFKNMGGMSEENKKKLEVLYAELEKFKIIGAEVVRRAEVSRTEAVAGGLLPETGKPTEPTVSSLQRIGGGGGVFGAQDPLLRSNERQVIELEKLNRNIEKALSGAKLIDGSNNIGTAVLV
jgi:methyl-accepting chemotaxis protein